MEMQSKPKPALFVRFCDIVVWQLSTLSLLAGGRVRERGGRRRGAPLVNGGGGRHGIDGNTSRLSSIWSMVDG
jgi:hypothetical protein